MKKIITTVGTSLLTNALGNNLSQNINYQRTKSLRYIDFETRKSQIDSIEKDLNNFIKREEEGLSAEINSLIKIAQEFKEPCDVYLIATDTILSPLCAEYIQKWFEKFQKPFISKIHFRKSKEFIIEDLQIKEKEAFEKKGLTNLFNRINCIAANYWDNIVFNITGGYKALIPYMTIAAQINNLPVFYNFQENNNERFDLLRIPNIPINVDFSLFDKYWSEIDQVTKTGIRIRSHQFEKDLNSILEVEGENMMLSSLGSVLWENYRSKFFLFYCPDDVYLEIEKTPEILKIMQEDFCREELRLNNINPEPNEHKFTYKRPRSVQRIYYFLNDERYPILYKVFNNHDDHERFFKNIQFTQEYKIQVINESKIRKLEIIRK
ncbi:MAG: hypothetical protein JXR48_10000 [Candidatus Delongbacteria bacterium]|nr:hypothetical protein [Candidatus Delongbacteria bacterium]